MGGNTACDARRTSWRHIETRSHNTRLSAWVMTICKAGLQSTLTGLLAWEHGQPGQVGNEAALTAATSAEIRLVNPAEL